MTTTEWDRTLLQRYLRKRKLTKAALTRLLAQQPGLDRVSWQTVHRWIGSASRPPVVPPPAYQYAILQALKKLA